MAKSIGGLNEIPVTGHPKSSARDDVPILWTMRSTIDQAAQVPGLAHRTAEREGLFVRAWLFGHFAPSLVARPRPGCP